MDHHNSPETQLILDKDPSPWIMYGSVIVVLLFTILSFALSFVQVKSSRKIPALLELDKSLSAPAHYYLSMDAPLPPSDFLGTLKLIELNAPGASHSAPLLIPIELTERLHRGRYPVVVAKPFARLLESKLSAVPYTRATLVLKTNSNSIINVFYLKIKESF
jgi:hypothetical protein